MQNDNTACILCSRICGLSVDIEDIEDIEDGKTVSLEK
jgi:hypothetical protein